MEKRFALKKTEGLLSKEQCIKNYTTQMDIKCEYTLNLVKRPAATTPEEKKARLAVMEAEMEDSLFKQTGIETQFLNESIVMCKFGEDSDFVKAAEEANQKLGQV